MYTPKLYVALNGIIAAIAGILMGFDTGAVAGALQFIVKTFQIDPSQNLIKGAIVSMVPIGGLLGAIASGYFSKSYGRRKSILLGSALFFVGTMTIIFAQNIQVVILGRFILGFAIGLLAAISPMYLAEIAPVDSRGAIIFLFQLAVTIGIFIAYIVVFMFKDVGAWRLMFSVGLIPAVILFLGMFVLPESPRWLAQVGRFEESKLVLQKICKPEQINIEYEKIKSSAMHVSMSLKSFFSSKHIMSLVAITFLLFAFQQLSGINTIFYYAPLIFTKAGFNPKSGVFVASISIGAVNVVASIFGMWLIDVIGRRKLLFIGFSGMTICLFVLGGAYSGIFGSHSAVLSLLAVFVYIICFAISLGGVPFVMMPELFPLNARSIGMATASCANWGFNFIVSVSFLSLMAAIGISKTYWLYALFCLLGLFFAYFFVPETKGRALEDIEANFYDDKPLRCLGDER